MKNQYTVKSIESLGDFNRSIFQIRQIQIITPETTPPTRTKK